MLCINSSLCVGDTHCCTAFICLFIYDYMILCFCLGKTEDVSYSKKLLSSIPSAIIILTGLKLLIPFFLSYSQRFDSSQVAKPTYRLPIIIIIFHNATIFFLIFVDCNSVSHNKWRCWWCFDSQDLPKHWVSQNNWWWDDDWGLLILFMILTYCLELISLFLNLFTQIKTCINQLLWTQDLFQGIMQLVVFHLWRQ